MENVVRCMGLTEERRRCPAEAAPNASYCSRHETQTGPADTLPNSTARFPGLVRRLSRSASAPGVRDDVRMPIPDWCKSSPTPLLIDFLLNDPDSTRRWLAAYALRRRRDPSAVDPLWQALSRDPSRFVRQQSAVALGKIGAPPVTAPLVEALWHDPDAAVRQACAIALGNLGNPSGAGELVQVLEREEDSFVRWDCILALGQLGDASCEELIRDIAEHDKRDFIQRACRNALHAIGKRSGQNKNSG